MIDENHNYLQGVKVLMLLDNPFVSDARVEKEARALVNSGALLNILSTSEKGFEPKESRNGYTIHRILPKGYNAPLRRSYSSCLKKCVQLIRQFNFDVLHCHDFYMLSIGAAYKKNEPNTILIYDAHEYLPGWPFYLTSSGINKFKGRIVWNRLLQKERKEVKFADSVITISSAISDRMTHNFKLQNAPIVIGNYPLPSKIETRTNYFHDKFNIDLNVKIIVQSGTIYQTDEELESLFNAIKSFENVVLVFIGDRPRFYQLKEKIERNISLNKNVFFEDYIHDHKELLNIMSSANFGLLHINSEWEAHKIGFSNRFVEYLMGGLPVIGTPQEFAKEINDHMRCGVFINEQTTKNIADSIRKVIEQESTLKENVCNLRETLNWNVESRKLIDLYKSFKHDK